MSRLSPRRRRPATSITALLMLATAAGLSGCGSDAPRRMGTGTASGAATGAAFGLIGGPIGVVIGGAIGGGIGALTASNTTPNQINLDNIGKTGPAAPQPVPQPVPQSVPGQVSQSQAPAPQGLRNQISQYQAQPQQSGYATQPAYGQPQPLGPSSGASDASGSVQSQPLPPPTTR